VARLGGVLGLALSLASACAMPCLADEANGEKETPKVGLKVGADLYYGLSNIMGPTKRHTDGQWAGVGYYYPSALLLDWAGKGGDAARMSFGVGDMYVGSDRTTEQPIECFYAAQTGSGRLTLGKHYVPFCLQEWQYETRWGAMYEADVSGNAVSVSLTHNRDTQALNTLARVGRKLADGTEVGISGAAGRGWSYGSSHAWGYGVDVTREIGAVTLTGEYMEARGGCGAFQFGFARLQVEAAPSCRPYLALYYAHDVADEMGEVRSGVLGVEVDVCPHFVLEPGIGRASGRNVWYVQGHLTF